MRVLLDTNIVIHREASRVVNKDIGTLFRWLDRLGYTKCVSPASLGEFDKLKMPGTRETMTIKLDAYHQQKTVAPLGPEVAALAAKMDQNENDKIDTILVNELYCGRVDLLISEDKRVREKARRLGLSSRTFSIESFLEKVTAENPNLADYRVLSVRKVHFGEVDIRDPFFDSFRSDYPGFDQWFARKSDEEAYICKTENEVKAFLYLKTETRQEAYPDIDPPFPPKKRLKIGTFKVTLNGNRLGERFLKIIFDNAIIHSVDEIYVTVFDRGLQKKRLIELLETFGFTKHGVKNNEHGTEAVYVRSMKPRVDLSNPAATYPFFSRSPQAYLVAIRPEYHTELLPDSILRTESVDDYTDNQPHRNAIKKVFISRSRNRSLRCGDVIVFYRTKEPGSNAVFNSVVTTVGIVENIVTKLGSADEFVRECRKRSVFTDEQLLAHWNYSYNKPFIVNFLSVYTFPRRPTLGRLIDRGVIPGPDQAPRGFEPITKEQFDAILEESEADARFVVD